MTITFTSGISFSGGVTITEESAASTYAMATLIKVASDTWMINGTGVI